MPKRLPLFWSVVITLVATYLLLQFGVPYASMLIAGRDNPLPVPGALMGIYLALILVGVFVYLAADEARLKEFWAPVETLLRGRDAQAVQTTGDRLFNIARWAVLVAIPLGVGGAVYSSLAPSATPPTTLRLQHPSLPFAYEKLTNPYRNADGTVDPAIIEEGRVLFQTNCRPCHGTPADGEGPMAYG
ncbi:MAG: hypothetical protein ACRDH2_20620, partial [Anaerolineales bacterium]